MIRRSSDGREFFAFGCHSHLGESSMMERYCGQGRVFLGPQMISNLDHFGIDMSVAFAMVDVKSDYGAHNEAVLEAAAAHPTRIVPFARLNPHYEEMAAASVAGYVERGMRGLKLHPFWDAFTINDPVLVRPIMEEANRFGLVVLFHTGEAWTTLPALVWDLACDYPDVKFIIGHSGQYGFDVEAWSITRRAENLWLDTSELWAPQRVRTMVDLVGKERVLFGTDAPYINSAAEIEKLLRFADLSDDELEAILGKNLLELLSIAADAAGFAPTVDYPHAAPIFWYDPRLDEASALTGLGG
jgi:predicted TIM-barrel fold metal-dependent hydrolase